MSEAIRIFIVCIVALEVAGLVFLFRRCTQSPITERARSNRLWFFVGVIPFLPGLLLLPLAVFAPRTLFGHFATLLAAPLYGFCPLDIFHTHTVPASGQLLVWGGLSGIAYLAVAGVGFCKWPFGIVFAALTWLSAIVLAFRLLGAFEHIH